MIVEVPRRWRWIMVALALVSLLELVALWRSGPAPDDATSVDRAPALDGAAFETAESTAPAPNAPPAASGRAEEIEVCGVGWVPAPASGLLLDLGALLRQPDLMRARERVLDRLARGSEFERIASRWFALRGVDGPPSADPASDAARDAVARAAATTADARVYALAFNLCQVHDPASSAGACQLIEARQWARLDPGNANPWLHVLADAALRKDRATQDEALYRIAASRRSASYFTALPGAVAGVETPDPPSTVAVMALSVDALGVAMAFAFPGYQSLLAACRGDELKDANRRQNCEAIAALLTDSSDSLLERGIGARMSVHLGAPETKADEVRGEIAGYSNSFQLAAFQSDAPALDCRSMHSDLQRLAQWSAIGEVQMAHNWARTSGKTPAMLGDEYRASQERRRVEAQREAAASAASAAFARRE